MPHLRDLSALEQILDLWQRQLADKPQLYDSIGGHESELKMLV